MIHQMRVGATLDILISTVKWCCVMVRAKAIRQYATDMAHAQMLITANVEMDILEAVALTMTAMG